MSVKELIESLQLCDLEDEVKCYDPESEQIESVTGLTYGGKDRVVELFTDNID
jgi:hypothetical protein